MKLEGRKRDDATNDALDDVKTRQETSSIRFLKTTPFRRAPEKQSASSCENDNARVKRRDGAVSPRHWDSSARESHLSNVALFARDGCPDPSQTSLIGFDVAWLLRLDDDNDVVSSRLSLVRYNP